jgi:outer membrane protein assembly factor BamB
MAFRPWGAFDSSGLVDATGDTLIQCGENGLVYKVKLNTEYDAATGSLSLAPQLTRYRYHVAGNDELGIESSPAAWKNFLYFTDNGGTLQCLDLNTMTPVWFDDVGDDTDCTTVIEETPEGVFLYTANEVDKRSNGGAVTNAPSQIRKYNAVTGERLWQVDVPCVYQYYINGGVLGTPLLGKDDISDLIIFNVALTGSNQSGKLIALSKKTGDTVWERDLPAYSWSSPVDVKSDDGTTYGLICGFDGYLRLFDPKTGKDLHKVSLGGNIESSPAVYNDMIVVGSYAKKIFGVRIR